MCIYWIDFYFTGKNSKRINPRAAPVKTDPVSFEAGRELRTGLFQSLHKLLLDKRLELRRTLKGGKGGNNEQNILLREAKENTES